MNRVRKKFVVYALIAVFVLLTVLLTLINGINFSMAARDADRITERISAGGGGFNRDQIRPARQSGPFDPGGQMGTNAPDIPFSARYFTYKINPDGTAEKIAFNISAFTEEEAKELAIKLSKESVGWTNLSYRFRVYREAGTTFVTVLDQSRELVGAYRILLISVIGELIGLAVCLGFLTAVSKRLFRPLEDADRKQKEFIAEAERQFKFPLTVISADAELLDRKFGPGEITASLRRQVAKMTEITGRMDDLELLEKGGGSSEETDLSEILNAALDQAQSDFRKAGIDLRREIESGIKLRGDPEALMKVCRELCENCLKFAENDAAITLKKNGERIELTSSNGTGLSDGNRDTVFDRFTRLENADGKPGVGLGLSYLKGTVKAHNGRSTAFVSDGRFTVRITL